MTSTGILLTVILSLTLVNCSEGGSQKKSRDDKAGQSEDAILTEEEVKKTLPFISIVEDYNQEGEIVQTTEYSYSTAPLHPSFETKNADGEVMRKVERVLDSKGLLLQTKTTEYKSGEIVEKIEDYERNDKGGVVNLIVTENGTRKRTEYLLSEDGREIRSTFFDKNDQPQSEREINWETNEISLVAFDSKGKPIYTWTTNYLKLEMVEGLLRPLFSLSQKQEVLTAETQSGRFDSECDTTTKIIKCSSTRFDGSDKEIEKTAVSFHVVPFDNGFYKYHDVVIVEKNTKKFENDVLDQELKINRRYADNFVIKSETSIDRVIGEDVVEKQQLYFYDDEGRPLSEEVRINDDFYSKKLYGY